MGSSVQPDTVASYLQKYGGGASTPHQPGGAVASYLAKYGAPAEPYADPGVLGWLQKRAESVVSGTPGAQTAVAGYRGIGKLLHGGSLQDAADEIQHTRQGEQKDVSSLSAWERIPEQILGGAPVAAALGGGLPVLGVKSALGAKAAGGVYGALQGAEHPADSLTDRAENTAFGGGLGILGTVGGQIAGRGIANIGARTGATEALANVLAKVPNEIPVGFGKKLILNAQNASTAMGTEGQVNNALSGRQEILDQAGDIGDVGQTAAQQQIAREAGTKAQAKVLYDVARKDVQPLDDPELNTLLADQMVQKHYQNVVRMRNAGSNPLPTVDAPEQMPTALGKLYGTTPESYANMLKLAAERSRIPAISGTDILPEELAGPKSEGVSLPDPQALASLRKELYNDAKGYQNSSSGLKQEEAITLLEKVDQITQKLNAASPARKAANQFYAGAKGEEEGFASGFDAFDKAKNLSGETLTTNSPEAQRLALETPRYRSEPPQAQQARGEAFRLGASGAFKGAVTNKPVDRGLQSILGLPELAPTQPAMQARSLMFSNSEDAARLEQTLAQLRGAGQELPNAGNNGPTPTSVQGLRRLLVRKLTQTPDLISTQKGQQLLTQLLGDPSALAGSIGSFRQGDAALSALYRTLGISAGGQAAR